MKSALVIGASRGIGRQICLTLASHGYNVTVAAKSVEETDKRPGTIHTVSEEVELYDVKALPVKCDVRSISDINNSVSATIASFGQLDFAIYNAGAILWRPVAQTPLKRFDLMHEVNSKGAYAMVQAVLPHFLEKKHGRILLIAPPIYSRFFKGKTPYAMTKVGASVLVHGLADELKGTGVTISALWPAVTTESHVTKVNHIERSMMRNACLFADACYVIGKFVCTSVRDAAFRVIFQ